MNSASRERERLALVRDLREFLDQAEDERVRDELPEPPAPAPRSRLVRTG